MTRTALAPAVLRSSAVRPHAVRGDLGVARASSSTLHKILVVDDSPTELAVMSALFHGQGFEVLTARDGDDALDKLGSYRPHLVLLDVVMPGKNGFSLCRQIRSTPEFGHTPIILVTSKDQPADRFWGLKQGANDYVTKPWDAAGLLQTVRKHL
jgi:twitching motility two-component system response regulator PilH